VSVFLFWFKKQKKPPQWAQGLFSQPKKRGCPQPPTPHTTKKHKTLYTKQQKTTWKKKPPPPLCYPSKKKTTQPTTGPPNFTQKNNNKPPPGWTTKKTHEKKKTKTHKQFSPEGVLKPTNCQIFYSPPIFVVGNKPTNPT